MDKSLQKNCLTVLVLVMLLMVPTHMDARRKKTVYLKTQSEATAYYRGEVNDLDEPEGEGMVVVEACPYGYAYRGEQILQLTGQFSKTGVSNAVLVVGTQPGIVFRGQLSYIIQAGRIDIEKLNADLQEYERRDARLKEKEDKLARTAEYLSEQEREQKTQQIEQERTSLQNEYERLWCLSSATTVPKDEVYGILRFTLKQGTLELEKWDWTNQSKLSGTVYSINADMPVLFNFVVNNGDVSFQNDIVARNRTLEQKVTGDVVDDTYVEEIRLFEVTPKTALRPEKMPKTTDADKDQLMLDDPWYQTSFTKTVLGNYLKGRRKTEDGKNQNIVIGKSGVTLTTVGSKENTVMPLGVINTQIPFIELRNDGIYIAETIGAQGIEARHPLWPKPVEEAVEEVVETPVEEPAPVVEAVPEVDNQEVQLRQRLSLNLMTDKSLMGPWQVESGQARSTWNFRNDNTMTFSTTDNERRTWTMDNHLITIRHTTLPNPSILEVLTFEPDTMQLKDTAGTIFILRRDTTLMTPEELATFRSATASFNDRMRVMTGEIPAPTSAAIPATVEVAMPAVATVAQPAVMPATETATPTQPATPTVSTEPTVTVTNATTGESLYLSAEKEAHLKKKILGIKLPKIRLRRRK
ncbi:MAG: hypothetical protein Q4E32_10570 [Bacteroidales bacterium]|nr:hypothetical protein [Bacteroidales bacterium]